MKDFRKDREVFIAGIIGKNRTGKSVTARKIAMRWKKAKPSYYKVIAFDPQNRFRGIADEFIAAGNPRWALDLQKERNALIILDDYRLINKSVFPVKGLEELISQRAEYNLDIIYICHNPALVINYLTYFTDRYYIFATNSKDGQFEDKIPNHDLCIAASMKVNQHVKKYGRGEYPSFPYCIVDTETEKVIAINMFKNNRK